MHISSSTPLTSPSILHSLSTSIQFRVLPPYKSQSDLNSLPTTEGYPIPILASSENGEDDIFGSNYKSGTWVLMSKVRGMFPFDDCYSSSNSSSTSTSTSTSNGFDGNGVNRVNGIEGSKGRAFDSYIKSLLSLTPHSLSPKMKTSDQAWKKFISTFLVARGLLGFEPILKAFVMELVRLHAEDNVAYLETRINFIEKVSETKLKKESLTRLS